MFTTSKVFSGLALLTLGLFIGAILIPDNRFAASAQELVYGRTLRDQVIINTQRLASIERQLEILNVQGTANGSSRIAVLESEIKQFQDESRNEDLRLREDIHLLRGWLISLVGAGLVQLSGVVLLWIRHNVFKNEVRSGVPQE